ncbi:MAG: DUF1566 domain-containing protein [Chitinophagia bacterium]
MFKIKLYKKSFFFIFLFFISVHSTAQSGIFFQAIARDINTNPAKDRKLYIQSSIIQSSPTGTKVLTEEHQTNTDAFGIFSIIVGNGLRVGGTVKSLSTIDWANGPYYLNLKIAITPISIGAGWDYSKEWVDIGTTIFGTVPFALYSASSAKIDEKLDATDTSKMLNPYARAQALQALSSTVNTKLATKDTAAMLAPYAKLFYNLDSNYLKKQINSLLGASDSIKYTKQTFTDSALLKKMNVFDTSIYAKQTFVDAVTYSQQKYIDLSLQSKLNIVDTIKYTKKAYTDSALITKLNNNGSAEGLTNFPTLNQNTTGNAATATYANTANVANTAITAGNITATSNNSLTSLTSLNSVGTITTGVWSASTIDIAHGGTGLSTAGSIGQVLTSTISGTLTWTNTSTILSAHYLGESFGGGIVFYVYDNGKHGLIVSTEDQSTGVYWSKSSSYTTTNAVRDGVNAGMANTERIIFSQGIGNYAAQVAANYKGGGFGDWYLPSNTELNLLYAQRQLMFSIGYSNTYYWSSNENPTNNTQAWAYNFTGTGSYGLKYYNSASVRAIRAF